ncbi:MAG: PepSY domain-containing protein, partial [Bacteroidales bacterium]
HVGSWGGWFSKLLTVIAALIGASLPITGYYFWIKRLKQKHNKT